MSFVITFRRRISKYYCPLKRHILFPGDVHVQKDSRFIFAVIIFTGLSIDSGVKLLKIHVARCAWRGNLISVSGIYQLGWKGKLSARQIGATGFSFLSFSSILVFVFVLYQ